MRLLLGVLVVISKSVQDASIKEALLAAEAELLWPSNSQVEHACLTSIHPLTAQLKYFQEDGSVRCVSASRPWRTFSWILEEVESCECETDEKD